MVYQIMEWIEPENEKMRMPLKIGLMTLYLSCGLFVMQEEIQEVIMSLYLINNNRSGCCLLHRLESDSPMPLFQGLKKRWSHNLEDFLCHCLSFDRKRRLSIEDMKKHPLITRHEEIPKVSFVDLLQLIKTENTEEVSNEVEEGYHKKLDKICDAIETILSNMSPKIGVELPIRIDNPVLGYLEEEIGLDKGSILDRVNRVYTRCSFR